MTYQVIATASFVVGLISATLGNSPLAAAGAFVSAGLFAIADAIKNRDGSKSRHFCEQWT